MFRPVAAIGFSLVVWSMSVRTEAAPVPATAKPPRRIRVLLFASSATREYQFLRSLLVRESDGRRAELSICLQPPPGREKPRTGVVQEVPKDRLLDAFPRQLDAYDVVVAFDPDWKRLNAETQTALQQWVRKKGGGLVLVAGPINTLQLTRPDLQDKLASILDLYPVLPLDPHLLKPSIDTSKPRRLSFPKTKAKYPFLTLDSKSKDDLAGWAPFFDREKPGDEKKNREPHDGFFSYFPTARVKPNTVVLASLADPKTRMKDGKDQPYLVVQQLEKGRVLYLGSGEVWRLRSYRREYYDRFWLGLLQYVSEGRPNNRRDG